MNEKKINVILAAHKLFKDKGYVETSILDIVKESKTSRGTFYNYFSSKAELLVEMNQYFQELLNQERALFRINYLQGDSEQLLREILYISKKRELDNKLGRIMAEASSEKEVNILEYIETLKKNRIYWLHDYVNQAFGESYPNATWNATIMLDSIINNHLGFNQLLKDPKPMQQVIDFCIDQVISCLDNINRHPLFLSIEFENQESISKEEQFIHESNQLIKWLNHSFADRTNYALVKEYVELLLRNRSLIETNPALVAHMKQQLLQELQDDYPAISNYIELIV